jgi:hypothetical protein
MSGSTVALSLHLLSVLLQALVLIGMSFIYWPLGCELVLMIFSLAPPNLFAAMATTLVSSWILVFFWLLGFLLVFSFTNLCSYLQMVLSPLVARPSISKRIVGMSALSF